MNSNSNSILITRSAIFIALLVLLQFATVPLGSTLITGSIVNLLLIISVMTCGLASGLSVAAVSPVMAKLLGIGPLWSLIPFIIIGNITLVLLWHFIGNMNMPRQYASTIMACITAAAAKFLVLYIGIVQIAIPVLLTLPAQQARVISNMFSIPQLVTALAGGAAAAVLLPPLIRALTKRQD